MKKILCLLLALVTCISLVACGNQATPNGNDNAVTDQEQPTGEIEIKIDSIAQALGLTDESEVMYDLIGAIAGKQYCDGNIELYQFDESSDAYKDLIGGKTYLTPAAYKDGVVLIFAFGYEADSNLIDAFNALEF